VRPPKVILERNVNEARSGPWTVDGDEVERRLAEEGGRELLGAMVPALYDKPFSLGVQLPTTPEGWTAEAATKVLRSLLKRFGLTVESRQYGGTSNRRRRYALVLDSKVDAALGHVLRQG
jgi:hypothetical protein